MNWTELLFNPIYGAHGVDGVILSSTGKADQTLTVLDKTSAKDIPYNVLTLETVGPAACVRAFELSEKNLDRNDLDEGTLTMNGRAWRIKSVKAKPSPNGETDGEYVLSLSEERATR